MQLPEIPLRRYSTAASTLQFSTVVPTWPRKASLRELWTQMKSFSNEELLTMLDDLESDRVERKERLSGDVKTAARQAVCAFANDLPGNKQAGVLFIGATDGGKPSKTPITDELLRTLSDFRSDGRIQPFPVISVSKEKLKGHDMAVITVMPSDMPPVRFDGRIWIRVGPRRAIASAQDERILNEKRKFLDVPFDLQPVPTASLPDLSRTVFENDFLPSAFAPDILETNGRTYEERLSSCKMIVSPDNTTPTVLGILTLGVRPQDFLPGAKIQFLRIEGTQLDNDVSDELLIDGTLSEVLRSAETKLQSHNRRAVDIVSQPRHQLTPDFPQVALQQILYNAVLHRTYEGTNAPTRITWFEDRVEIISPGGPYGSVNQKNFGQSGITDYRNPNIADVLKTLGYVQSFGRGIPTARSAMAKNGNPEIEFECSQSAVSCTLRRKK